MWLVKDLRGWESCGLSSTRCRQWSLEWFAVRLAPAFLGLLRTQMLNLRLLVGCQQLKQWCVLPRAWPPASWLLSQRATITIFFAPCWCGWESSSWFYLLQVNPFLLWPRSLPCKSCLDHGLDKWQTCWSLSSMMMLAWAVQLKASTKAGKLYKTPIVRKHGSPMFESMLVMVSPELVMMVSCFFFVIAPLELFMSSSISWSFRIWCAEDSLQMFCRGGFALGCVFMVLLEELTSAFGGEAMFYIAGSFTGLSSLLFLTLPHPTNTKTDNRTDTADTPDTALEMKGGKVGKDEKDEKDTVKEANRKSLQSHMPSVYTLSCSCLGVLAVGLEAGSKVIHFFRSETVLALWQCDFCHWVFRSSCCYDGHLWDSFMSHYITLRQA